MCHGHLGRAPSRAGRAWHIGGRTLFGPTQGEPSPAILCRLAQKNLKLTSTDTLHATGSPAFMAGLNFQVLMVSMAF